ncbi:hypothetical protein AAFF_G00364180 [Aldrovandia affinis]|uniref:RING finger protein 122 n=1 Tax=Aldrovandia affinis TaxID=143900 RepID=A0AAD7WMQ9_9TELE|nr:hypothetical protein AAFF_G00364180 [Aldrovandia affinis]
MTSGEIYHLPLNVYVIILGVGLFIFMLSMIFCCYLFRVRRQGTREQYGYNEVVLKGTGKKLSLLGQTCAVCLEEFRTREELGLCPCSHAFHKKCLVKWLEIRSVCPMCNKPICRQQPDNPQGAEGPQNPQELHPFIQKSRIWEGEDKQWQDTMPDPNTRRRNCVLATYAGIATIFLFFKLKPKKQKQVTAK